MAVTRDALVDMGGAASADVDILSYLKAAGTLTAQPASWAPKPIVVDDHGNGTVDGALWADINTSLAESTFLGRDSIQISDGSVATPGWSEAGLVYIPAITASLGTTIFSRFIMERSCDFVVGLHDAVFGGNTLHYADTAPAATPDEMIGLRFYAGGVSVVRGSEVSGDETPVDGLNWRVSHPTDVDRQFVIQVGITFTAVGYFFTVHLPGIIPAPVVVHTEVRSTSHPAGGYKFFVDKFSTDDVLGFYNLSVAGFESAAELVGGQIVVKNTNDVVLLSSLQVTANEGYSIGGNGTIHVRFPSLPGVLGTTLYELSELPTLTTTLTGSQQYPIDFIIGGDIVLEQAAYYRVEDQTFVPLTAE